MQDTRSKSQDIVFEIKNRLDIVDVISEHIVLKKSGMNFWGKCPFHQEKTPSFSVNPDKNIFKCFGCGAGGDSISFLMKINNNTFWETITDLAQKFGLELPSHQISSEKTEIRNRIYELNLETASFYANLLESQEGKKAKEYLLARGLENNIISKFMLGYSPKQPDGLINHLKNKFKTDFELLEKAGLISKRNSGEGYTDRFRNRLMIPILDEKANVIAFGARSLEESQQPKYLNSSDTPVFNKGRTLYGLYQAKDSIKQNDSAVIMEGYFDVISAHAYGLTNVVATLGTALTEHQVKLLARYTNSRRIYMAFDIDEAGINATSRGAETIKNLFSGLGDVKQFDESFTGSSAVNDRSVCEIRVVSTISGKDPDEFIRTEGIEAYRKLVKTAPLLIDYQINRIIKSKDGASSPQDKAHALKELIPVLAEIKNSIIRNEYVKLVAERLYINEESLTIEIKKSLQTNTPRNTAIKPIANKNSEKNLIAQKNLLSLYFINSDKLPILCINNYLKEVSFTDQNYLLIKEKIEKITQEVEGAEELTSRLLLDLANNEEAKQTLVDIIFSLDDKKDLDEKQLIQYIDENITYLKNWSALKEQESLKSNYRALKNDEDASIELQKQVMELVKMSSRRLENIQ